MVRRPGLGNKKVAVAWTGLTGYPHEVPFDPPERYPEYRRAGVNPANGVYARVRELLYGLGLDREHFDTPEWNPLGEIIEPGMTVFLKPNLVLHRHLRSRDVFSVIVHASMVRPLLDYVCLALRGAGRIIVGDAQQIFGEFGEALRASQLGPLLDWSRGQTGVEVECFDLRTVRGTQTWLSGPWGREPVAADPRGYQEVDLGSQSQFVGVDANRLRISVASCAKMRALHGNGRHAYVFPRSVLASDVILSIPKLKTHRRTGVSLALKNSMGFPAAKECLPHYQTGSVPEGGDEYVHPSWRKRACSRLLDRVLQDSSMPVKLVATALKKLLWYSHWVVPFRDPIEEGMWYGNDTLWRTLLDLNRIVFYADKNGRLCPTPQRHYFCLVDGIIAGEENGPLEPNPVAAGVLVAGFSPVAVDVVGASLMGFDVEKIPSIRKALEDERLYQEPSEAITVLDGTESVNLGDFQRRRDLHFAAHPYWKGHIERA